MYLDEPQANTQDRKSRAWLEKDLVTKGTVGGVQGFVIILYFLLL